ncbi:MAG: amidohydrolase family protein [Promethearchaeota archaeon]
MGPDWHFLPPKYNGLKIDAHTHLHLGPNGDFTGFDKVLNVADANHITQIAAIIDEDLMKELNANYPDRFIPIRFLRSKTLLEGGAKAATEMIEEIYSQEYRMVKFWFAPRWKDYVEQEFHISTKDIKVNGLSSPLFAPIFETIETLGLKFLIHISDPDLWYEKKYQPASKYGTKSEHLKDFEQVMDQYPKIQFQVAHFGAQPENLPKLARWLDTYPNLMIDTGSARWMGRVLSRNPEKSRDFIEKYSDRILFGTDLSFGWTRDNSPEKYFLTRYFTFHTLFETDLRNVPLPFPDPENGNKTVINGLNLSKSTLEKIYWKNAQSFYQDLLH